MYQSGLALPPPGLCQHKICNRGRENKYRILVNTACTCGSHGEPVQWNNLSYEDNFLPCHACRSFWRPHTFFCFHLIEEALSQSPISSMTRPWPKSPLRPQPRVQHEDETDEVFFRAHQRDEIVPSVVFCDYCDRPAKPPAPFVTVDHIWPCTLRTLKVMIKQGSEQARERAFATVPPKAVLSKDLRFFRQ